MSIDQTMAQTWKVPFGESDRREGGSGQESQSGLPYKHVTGGDWHVTVMIGCQFLAPVLTPR